ncbi:hypothetical protein OG562_08070 [Streptomyces sp. NBC_01275]|uniref:hypothetical protein n=1 Tax=Streptomyces sp. NBC_01275 TaxID=2903807 RepID=UPI002253FE04|nr:hypothetical protein [Streptomyces sp. NBC_01275]MCX4760924.1 hypothetical protein [Streptomyces sp. NBC_01275]
MVLGSDRRRGNARRASGALAAVLVLVLAPALTACGDGGGNGGAEAGTAPQTSKSAAASGTAPADPAAAEQRIRQNWVKFFDPATSAEDKQALLENGEQMGPVLEAFSGDQRGGQVAAKVEKVEFTGPTGATVTYDLTLNGATALPGASGTAVEQDGVWKVSVNTLCALVRLSGDAASSAAPGC